MKRIIASSNGSSALDHEDVQNMISSLVSETLDNYFDDFENGEYSWEDLVSIVVEHIPIYIENNYLDSLTDYEKSWLLKRTSKLNIAISKELRKQI